MTTQQCSMTHPKTGEQCRLEANHPGNHKLPVDVHRCHVPKCNARCEPEKLMCASCWKLVPLHLRKRVYETYRDGQCDDKSPSVAWHKAADAAIKAVTIAKLARGIR